MVDLLEFCKREIASSSQWKVFSQQLFIHIRQHLNASGVMFFTDLSEQERLHVTTQASELIKASNNAVFQDMLTVVSNTIDTRVNEYTSLHKGNRSRNDVLMEILAFLSSQLLFKWPNHKHLLLQCFNRTLPAVLRAMMWQLMLQNKQVYQSFVTMATNVASQDPKSSGYHGYQQCQQVIGSNRIFSVLIENKLCLQVMKDVLTFWRLQCGKEYVSQLDILLCIPFVYVRLRELEAIRERNKPNMEQFIASVCEQYVSFMTQRPPTMMDERLSVSVCVCGWGCVCVHVRVHACKCVYMFVCVWMRACLCVCAWVCVWVCVCACAQCTHTAPLLVQCSTYTINYIFSYMCAQCAK